MRMSYLLVKRGWTAVLLGALVVCVVAGCGGGGGGSSTPLDTTAPAVSVSSWTRNLTATGGSVTIEAQASDSGSGIANVEARITPPSGTVVTVAMSSTSTGVYTGTYVAPANSGTTKMTYTFTVYATDKSSNSASNGAFSFDVPASENPPDPPPFQID